MIFSGMLTDIVLMMPRKTIIVCTALLAVCFVAAQAREDEKAHKVTIKNLKYDPPTLKIKAGETVLWTNTDDNDHTVTSDDKDGFSSDNLGSGEKFRHTFEKKGKFPYHCKYHPRMKGLVIVGE
jgi:plastocyanin